MIFLLSIEEILFQEHVPTIGNDNGHSTFRFWNVHDSAIVETEQILDRTREFFIITIRLPTQHLCEANCDQETDMSVGT